MNKKYDIEIRIDNNRIDPICVYPLKQSDPFPGGHRYWMQIIGPDILDLFRINSESLEIKLVPDWDQILSSILSNSDIGNRKKYLLNSVEKIERRNEGVAIIGICSEVKEKN
jgi:hypothetical protein